MGCLKLPHTKEISPALKILYSKYPLKKNATFFLEEAQEKRYSGAKKGINLNPFGMTMQGRSFVGENSRFGYNGKERDPEYLGGNAYDYSFRLLDPRIGRWFKTDRYAWQYAYDSPYSFAENTPIMATDENGDKIYFVGVNSDFNRGFKMLLKTQTGRNIISKYSLSTTHDVYITVSSKSLDRTEGNKTTNVLGKTIPPDYSPYYVEGRLEDEATKGFEQLESEDFSKSKGREISLVTLDGEDLKKANDNKIAEAIFHEFEAHIENAQKNLPGGDERYNKEHEALGIIPTKDGPRVKQGSPLSRLRQELKNVNQAPPTIVTPKFPGQEMQLNFNFNNPAGENKGVEYGGANEGSTDKLGGTIETTSGSGNEGGAFSQSYEWKSCFVAGTIVTMSDGAGKPIEKIEIGDKILSFNPLTMRVENDTVLAVSSPIHNDIVTITFSDSTINRNTFDHPYYVKGKGWSSYKPEKTMVNYGIHTKQLSIGDTCYKYLSGKLFEIIVISSQENIGEVKTYNIASLKHYHSYFANGIIVNNEQSNIITVEEIK